MNWILKKIVYISVFAITVSAGVVMYFYFFHAKESEVLVKLPTDESVQKFESMKKVPTEATSSLSMNISRADDLPKTEQGEVFTTLESGKATPPAKQNGLSVVPVRVRKEAQALLEALNDDSTVRARKFEIGTEYAPLKLHFETNVDTINAGEVESILGDKTLKCAIVIVVGHADSTGPDEYNTPLSERRAKGVAMRLAAMQGKYPICKNSQIHTVGMGERSPVSGHYVNNQDSKENRRVEIFVLE